MRGRNKIIIILATILALLLPKVGGVLISTVPWFEHAVICDGEHMRTISKDMEGAPRQNASHDMPSCVVMTPAEPLAINGATWLLVFLEPASGPRNLAADMRQPHAFIDNRAKRAPPVMSA